jgi:enoyl-CoA hydratase
VQAALDVVDALEHHGSDTLDGVIDVRVDERVATLTLADPERRNALTLATVDAIAAAMGELEGRADVGAVVVTGAGTSFCAGADLAILETTDRAGLSRIYEAFLRIARSPLPTLAAVNGPAVGAGFNLALCCDVRLAARSARFVTRFLDIGLHPGGGHTWLLQRAVGAETAAALLLFGEELDGEAAARAGLAYRCVDDDALLADAAALARRAASAPAPLVARVKDTLRGTAALGAHVPAVELELDAQEWSTQQAFFHERIGALRARITSRQ